MAVADPSRQHNRAIEECPNRKGSAHAPKHIKFVTELPMTGVGKVDKKVLKAGFWAGRERMVG
jgi:fatty-acyl-CoA synthase